MKAIKAIAVYFTTRKWRAIANVVPRYIEQDDTWDIEVLEIVRLGFHKRIFRWYCSVTYDCPNGYLRACCNNFDKAIRLPSFLRVLLEPLCSLKLSSIINTIKEKKGPKFSAMWPQDKVYTDAAGHIFHVVDGYNEAA